MTIRHIQLRPDADPARARRALGALGLWTTPLLDADGRTIAYTVDPPSPPVDPAAVTALPDVARVLRAQSPHPRVDARADTPVTVRRAHFGGPDPVLIAGPCSVDAPDTIHAAAAHAAAAGATALRGGAYKPRTSPYAFDGHGPDALAWMRAAADAHDLAMITEVLSEHDVDCVAAAADVLQIGSRNMQNYALLRAAGQTGHPILLKRGMAATTDEWLLAGEHLLVHGAAAVIYCERGVRGFDPAARNLIDLGAVALLAHAHRQPVIVDPSHAAGRRDLIAPLARAALAAGACGVMIESHPDPTRALSDAPQATDPHTLRAIGAALGLTPAPPVREVAR